MARISWRKMDSDVYHEAGSVAPLLRLSLSAWASASDSMADAPGVMQELCRGRQGSLYLPGGRSDRNDSRRSRHKKFEGLPAPGNYRWSLLSPEGPCPILLCHPLSSTSAAWPGVPMPGC